MSFLTVHPGALHTAQARHPLMAVLAAAWLCAVCDPASVRASELVAAASGSLSDPLVLEGWRSAESTLSANSGHTAGSPNASTSGWWTDGRVVPASWRSLVDEAGATARVWTRRVEVGARVLKGNTDQDFVRVAGELRRVEGNAHHQIDWGGRFGQVNGIRNTNRWFVDSTVDREQPAGWILYLSSKHEYNEFQGIDYRGTGSIGGGYKFVDEDDRQVLMRLGPAVTMEVYSKSGGYRVTEDFYAEFEIDWPLFERSRLETKTTMRPSVVSLDVFRFRTDTAVVVPLDDESRWSLKLGYLLDYNSSLKAANNRLPMDVTTNVSVVYMRP